MKPDWVARYQAGQRAQVWHELRQLGASVRNNEFLSEAQLVCDQMARRARQNIEMIVGRLSQDGFQFHTNDDDRRPLTPYIPPSATAAHYAERLDQKFGPLPLTLIAWIRIVGDVWLVGPHPHWSTSAKSDPLVLQVEGLHYPDSSIEDYFADQWENWRRQPDDANRRPFVLELAPDRLHKSNVSGGAPYGIILPDACTDGFFRGEIGLPFIEYLNSVFRRAGFPYATGGGRAEWEITYQRGQDLLEL